MKKIITILILSCLITTGYSQTNYYINDSLAVGPMKVEASGLGFDRLGHKNFIGITDFTPYGGGKSLTLASTDTLTHDSNNITIDEESIQIASKAQVVLILDNIGMYYEGLKSFSSNSQCTLPVGYLYYNTSLHAISKKE